MDVRPMVRWRSLILTAMGAAGWWPLFGCSEDCPDLGRPSLPSVSIEVWDAVSGEPVVAGLSGVAVVADASIQMERDGSSNELRVYGPAGTYELFVAADGYTAWYRGDVEVTGSRCYVDNVTVRADLAPAPSRAFHPEETEGSRTSVAECASRLVFCNQLGNQELHVRNR